MSDLPHADPKLRPLFDAALPQCGDFLAAANDFRDSLLSIGPDTPPEPRWKQDWFPRLDALAAYVTVRRVRPARIVEIGAGHSTRFLARAVRDGGLNTRITSFDPEPRATLNGLSGVELICAPIQSAGSSVVPELVAGDILFVDSSHKWHPGSDVAFLFDEILPLLVRGCRVHFHDIFLPGGYPAHWTHRQYNEQVAVAALVESRAWQIEFASAHAVRHLADEIDRSVAGEIPLVVGAIESSLWLRKL